MISERFLKEDADQRNFLTLVFGAFVLMAVVQSVRNSGYCTTTTTITTTQTDHGKRKIWEKDLVDLLKRNSKLLSETDFEHTETRSEDLELGEERGNIIISDGDSKSVSNACAICLESYEPGESVVWSANHECPHAYHENCITEYCLKKSQKGVVDHPCPCCRQSFVVLQETDESEEQNEV